jgi:nonribosomal peptide synthetase protein BlmVI
VLKNLGETLKRAAVTDPEAPACSFLPDGEQCTDRFAFAELDRQARAVAGHLHESGLTGSRVLLVHPPGPDFVVALFACFYAGVTAVPVVPPESRYRAARARVETIAAACAPAAQLTSSGSGPALDPEVVSPIDTDAVPAADGSFTPLDVGPESTAILQFTSGATRAPRGVVLSHRSVLATST